MIDEEYQKLLMKNIDPSYMETVSLNDLYENVYTKKPPIIDGLLYPGTYLFVGAPKVGKSFFVAQLAYHISTGTPLWDYPVRQGTVLYMALEDDYSRLQERLYRMFGTDGTDRLFFSVEANSLGGGLDDQLSGFLEKHRDTTLVIIDTLQTVREADINSYSYSSDYEVISRLKKKAEAYGICLLLVHHTRKQQSSDKFDMISGTNGLLGAADGAFILHKETRTSHSAILEISGRDQQDQRIYLTRNPEKLSWDFERVETELWKKPPEPLLEKIAEIITEENPNWSGSPTELAECLNCGVAPSIITRILNPNAGRLLDEYGIRYDFSRTHDGRKISFRLEKKIEPP